MVIFGFCKDWAVEKCTETPFKTFWKPRNEKNKSRYFFFETPCNFHTWVELTILNVMAFKFQMYVLKDGLEKTRNVISSLILTHHGKKHKLPVRKMELI